MKRQEQQPEGLSSDDDEESGVQFEQGCQLAYQKAEEAFADVVDNIRHLAQLKKQFADWKAEERYVCLIGC